MKIFIALLLTICNALVNAQTAPQLKSPNVGNIGPGMQIPQSLAQSMPINAFDTVKAVRRLPITGLSIVESSEGKVFLVSDNGRVAIIGGNWIDLWEGKPFTNVANSVTLDKINLPRMGIQPDEFAPFVIGKGSKIVTVFVDPLCDECRTLVKQMPALGDQYTFRVAILALHGSESGLAARRLHCSPDKKLALDAFINKAFSTLPEPPKNCDVLPIQKVLITANVMGIRSTPFFVLPDFTTISTVNRNQMLTDILSRK